MRKLLSAGERLPKAASSPMPQFPQLQSIAVRGAARRENGVLSILEAAVLWGRTMVVFNDSGRGGNGELWSCLFKWY